MTSIIASLCEINGDGRLSKQNMHKSPARQLSACQVKKTQREWWVWVFYDGKASSFIVLLHAFYALSLISCSLEILLQADMVMSLNIYYTRKWRGKRLEAFLTIFTSLPPLFSFSSSGKRLSFIMISARASTDLYETRQDLADGFNML